MIKSVVCVKSWTTSSEIHHLLALYIFLTTIIRDENYSDYR